MSLGSLKRRVLKQPNITLHPLENTPNGKLEHLQVPIEKMEHLSERKVEERIVFPLA